MKIYEQLLILGGIVKVLGEIRRILVLYAHVYVAFQDVHTHSRLFL